METYQRSSRAPERRLRAPAVISDGSIFVAVADVVFTMASGSGSIFAVADAFAGVGAGFDAFRGIVEKSPTSNDGLPNMYPWA